MDLPEKFKADLPRQKISWQEKYKDDLPRKEIPHHSQNTYSHPKLPSTSTPKKFFKNKSAPATASKRQRCVNYDKGICTLADDCMYAHVDSNSDPFSKKRQNIFGSPARNSTRKSLDVFKL